MKHFNEHPQTTRLIEMKGKYKETSTEGSVGDARVTISGMRATLAIYFFDTNTTWILQLFIVMNLYTQKLQHPCL
jgi:hypothetical protein